MTEMFPVCAALVSLEDPLGVGAPRGLRVVGKELRHCTGGLCANLASLVTSVRADNFNLAPEAVGGLVPGLEPTGEFGPTGR